MVMRSNKVKTAVQWFHISRAVFAGFSGHGNSIYKYSIEKNACIVMQIKWFCRYYFVPVIVYHIIFKTQFNVKLFQVIL